MLQGSLIDAVFWTCCTSLLHSGLRVLFVDTFFRFAACGYYVLGLRALFINTVSKTAARCPVLCWDCQFFVLDRQLQGREDCKGPGMRPLPSCRFFNLPVKQRCMLASVWVYARPRGDQVFLLLNRAALWFSTQDTCCIYTFSHHCCRCFCSQYKG